MKFYRDISRPADVQGQGVRILSKCGKKSLSALRTSYRSCLGGGTGNIIFGT